MGMEKTVAEVPTNSSSNTRWRCTVGSSLLSLNLALVIADFDATLTKYWVNGCPGHTSHGLLQLGNPECEDKMRKLCEFYYPIKQSLTIPFEEKAKHMEEWQENGHALLIEAGLTLEAIKRSVADAKIEFREGVVELLNLLEERGVPVLILSAGLTDVIEEILRQKLPRFPKNVKIVSNQMVFSNDGRLVSFKGKTIHVLNKNEHALDMASSSVHDQFGETKEQSDDNVFIKRRTNALLLGDHIGDLGMSDGLNYEYQITVGFLNDDIEKFLETFQKAFDIVYVNDAPMWGVVELVSQICPSRGH
ncbi:cytosolic 5'-nucleotidase 3A-like isoform X2 [Macadamia integrifolia]|uniref:cytosolic 5'-nucleotidase 3A-like isoform X2 n=1 Tax=Macadamia integrifolia TaxID=60698 RepID=UPI001C4FD108|nr:cytosolic 5'-nucleotidase 3A-like isoform X2 [Macadamia integrifolia]